MIAARQIFLGRGASLPSIDGIMMLGWSIDTGLTGASASASFEVSVEFILPNMSNNSGENDFLGNFNGNAGNTLLLGVNSNKPYVFAFGSNRAPSIVMPWVTPVTYDITVDYSGSIAIDVSGTQSSASVSVSGFSASSNNFLIGNGGTQTGGYRPCPTVFKRVTFTLDGNVVADYIPAISGGKIGMQDAVRGTFASAPSGGVTLAYVEDMQ